MSQEDLRLSCPTCGRQVDCRRRAKNPFFPFCSERCRLIDLGKWLDGEHRISEPLPDGSDGSDEQDKKG